MSAPPNSIVSPPISRVSRHHALTSKNHAARCAVVDDGWLQASTTSTSTSSFIAATRGRSRRRSRSLSSLREALAWAEVEVEVEDENEKDQGNQKAGTIATAAPLTPKGAAAAGAADGPASSFTAGGRVAAAGSTTSRSGGGHLRSHGRPFLHGGGGRSGFSGPTTAKKVTVEAVDPFVNHSRNSSLLISRQVLPRPLQSLTGRDLNARASSRPEPPIHLPKPCADDDVKHIKLAGHMAAPRDDLTEKLACLSRPPSFPEFPVPPTHTSAAASAAASVSAAAAAAAAASQHHNHPGISPALGSSSLIAKDNNKTGTSTIPTAADECFLTTKPLPPTPVRTSQLSSSLPSSAISERQRRQQQLPPLLVRRREELLELEFEFEQLARRRDNEKQVALWAHEVARLEAETSGIFAEWEKQQQQQQEEQHKSQHHQHHHHYPQQDDKDRQQQLTQKDLQLSAGGTKPMSPTSPKAHSPVFEKLSFFKRWKPKTERSPADHPSAASAAGDISPTSTSTPPLTPPSNSLGSPPSTVSASASSVGTPLETPAPSVDRKPSAAPLNMPSGIQPGGRGIVPLTDAPRGASNGGDRVISVLCKGIAVNISVGSDATVQEALEQLKSLGQPVDLNACALSEQYVTMGLERRIRRYERIRDVLNSWDTDAQNALVLTQVSESDRELYLNTIPKPDKTVPNFCLILYHCQKPGKWSKRYIRLLENGQMLASKKPEGDGDNLCHLSDFDLYIPSESLKRKTLRPPKRFCFAIKSQQKRRVFINAENYAQYFCTEEPGIANTFRASIHAWRSQYVAQKQLQLNTKVGKPPQIVPVSYEPRRVVRDVGVANGHRTRVSVDESPYNLGTFQPLIDPQLFNKPLDDFGKDWTHDQTKESSVRSTRLQNATAFATNGLLGKAYEERMQQVQKEGRRPSQAAVPVPNGPFTEGPSLLSNARTQQPQTPILSPTEDRPMTSGSPGTTARAGSRKNSAGWFPSAVEHSAKQRAEEEPAKTLSRRPSTASRAPNRAMSTYRHRGGHGNPQYEHNPPMPQQRQVPAQDQRQQRPRGPPQPLVDLTIGFVEPPQWSRDGRGRGVRAPQGKPLVDLATGPVVPPGAASRFMQEGPPKPLIRRGEQAPMTLLQQQEQRHHRPLTSNGGQGPPPSSGLNRRVTVRSSAGSIRPGTSGTTGSASGQQGGDTHSYYPPASGSMGRTRTMTSGEGQGGMDPRLVAQMQQMQIQQRQQQQQSTGQQSPSRYQFGRNRGASSATTATN